MGPPSSTSTEAPSAVPSEDPPSASALPSGKRLGAVALRASIFEVIGYGGSQVLRLGSNLVLTRLLYPEAFGLLAIVNAFNMGLILLTDVGIEPAVVQSPRGDDRPFLNTAWSINLIRGAISFLVSLMLAWPMARFYREPQLAVLIAVGSLSVAIDGLRCTSVYTLRRKLQIGKLTLIELGAQTAAVVVMLPWAWLNPSPWALVAGALSYQGFRVVASYAIEPGFRNQFGFEPASRKAILDFSKWILLSSSVYFVARQGDRLLLGRFMGVADLGIYSIALMLSETVSTVYQRVTSGVLFPVLSRKQDEERDRLRAVYYRARLAMDALAMPAVGGLTAMGPWVIHLLYDQRYSEAGWMLQALAFRVAVTCIVLPCESTLLALGRTRYGLFLNVSRLVWLLVMIPVGAHALGIRGLLLAVATVELPGLAIVWPAMRSVGMLRLLLEARAALFYAAGLGIGMLIMRTLS